jgi:hypothetical protein
MIEFDIQLEQTGLKRLSDKLSKFVLNLETQSKDALKQVGEQYYDIVISRMGESQGGEMIFSNVYWQPLSTLWLEEKRKHGWVEEIWEATGEIKNNVRIFDVTKTSEGWSIFVGLKGVAPDVLIKAVRNEFGAEFNNNKVPARPLFEPARREMIYNPTEKAKILEAFRNATRLAINGIWK